jgi:hypothetical protein
LPTVDSDKTQTQWYKEMYGQIHKSPERKKGKYSLFFLSIEAKKNSSKNK